MTESIPGPAYRIVTPRLVIRCWEPRDAPLLHDALISNKEHLLPWLPFAADEPKQLQDKIELIRHWRARFDKDEDYTYGIFSIDECEVIGGSGLHTRPGKDAREIGYWIGQAHTRCGLATELAAALTKVAFEVSHMQRVEIHVAATNIASTGVARKLGYVFEGTLRKRLQLHNGLLDDSVIFTLLADEYPSSPAAALVIQAFDVIGRRLL